MNREKVYEILLPVFRDVFDDRKIKISDSTTSRDIMGWDSLVHINLIAAIEDEFDIKTTKINFWYKMLIFQYIKIAP